MGAASRGVPRCERLGGTLGRVEVLLAHGAAGLDRAGGLHSRDRGVPLLCELLGQGAILKEYWPWLEVSRLVETLPAPYLVTRAS